MTLSTALRQPAKRLYKLLLSFICRREYKQQRFVAHNERPVEYRFVFEQVTRLAPRDVLDVGTGMTALPHLLRTCGCVVSAIDNVRDYWPAGMVNRHFWVIDDDITRTRLEQQFDLITCISTLEHIHGYDQAVACMFKLLRPGGHLVLTFPYHEQQYQPNVYELPGSSEVGKRHPFVTQAFSRATVDGWLAANAGSVVTQEYWRFFDGEYWTEGKRLQSPMQVSASERHQISCLLLRKAATADGASANPMPNR